MYNWTVYHFNKRTKVLIPYLTEPMKKEQAKQLAKELKVGLRFGEWDIIAGKIHVDNNR